MYNSDNVAIGKRLSVLREVLDMSQETMANSLGITLRHYGDIERGQSGLSRELLIKIITSYDVSADYLLVGQISRENNDCPLIKLYNEIPSSLQEGFVDVVYSLQQYILKNGMS